MALLKKPFGKTGKDEEKPAAKTTLRNQEPGQGLTTLEIADSKKWEVKSLPEWKPGDVIMDTYEIEGIIPGGMGNVYIARHRKWNRKLAIKAPNEMMLSDKDNFARILREANSWTELGLHPNIAYCYYVRNIEDVPHLVVEYVDGGNLKDWIEDGKCIDYRVNLNLAIQFCHGMEYAHSKGMIHRDIKPENVLMTRDGQLKITDFGLVKGESMSEKLDQAKSPSKKEESNLTQLGDFMGTEGYLSPEQAENAADVDERTDIFSFGVCLYEMFCGNKPYKVTYGLMQEAPDPVKLSHDEKFPSRLAKLLKKIIRWNRDERYHSFEDIRLELAEIYNDLYNEESPYAELKLVDVETDNFNNQGVSYMEIGDKEKARECFEKAVKLNSIHPQAVYNLSLIQWRNVEIDDSEVLRRLEHCRDNPSADKEALAELMANIHVERYSPGEAKKVLKDYPEKYNELFKCKEIPAVHCIHTFEGHTRSVNSVTFSPDSRYALSGSDDDTLKLWEIATGRCIRTFNGHTSGVNYVSFSPDGRNVFSVGYEPKLWDIDTGRCIRTFCGHPYYFNSIHCSPDGRYELSGDWDNTLKLWDIDTGKCIRTFNGHTGYINSVCFSPDGRYAISGSDDKILKLWEIETGRCIRTVEGHSHSVFPGSFSPDGRYALSGSGDKILKLMEIETGRCIRTLKGHTDEIISVSFSPDGRYALSGSWDDTLKLWKIETGRCIRTLEGHTGFINSVCFSPDGRYALSGSHDDTLKLWDIPCLKCVSSPFYISEPKRAEDLKNDEEMILNAEELFKKGDYNAAYSTAFGLWQEKGFASDKGILKLYLSLIKKAVYTNMKLLNHCTLSGHTDWVRSVCFSPDGKYGLSGSEDGTLKLWEIETGKCIRTFEEDTSSINFINSVCFSPDGRYAFSGCEDDTLKLWEIQAGKCIRTFEGHTKKVLSVSFSPDGRYGLSGSVDKTLKLWEIKTGRFIRTLEGHTGFVNSVCFSPDGKYALSGSDDNTLKLWEIETGRCIRTLKGHTGSVNSVCFSPDGRCALSGSDDDTLKLWEIGTGRCIRTLEGHTGSVYSVCLSPDGRYALSGSGDKTLKLWEIETGKCIRILEREADWLINSVCFSPDGRYALSDSLGNTIKLWKIVLELEFPDPVDWDEAVRPYLKIFLTLRKGKWTEDDFKKLIDELAEKRGLGWVRPEGIRKELEKMTKEWKV